MKNYLRAITLFMTVCLVLCSSSCGKTNSAVDAAQQSTAAEGSDEADVPAETELTDDLGEYNFEGKAFNTTYCEGFFFAPYDVSEENGELLNDTAYRRNRYVEERFNIVMEYSVHKGSGSEATDAIIKNVMAGDESYTLGIVHPFIGLTKLISGGYAADWNKVPNVNFTKPWWNKRFIEQLSIGDILPCANSDFIYFNSGAIYFNKEILSNYKLDNPYELVYNGKWTWDKLSEMAKAVSSDINGDGTFDEHDRYGYSIIPNHRMVPITHSYGIMSSSINSEGYPTVENINTEKMHSVVENYHDLLYNNPGAYRVPDGKDELALFRNGQVLFLHYVIQNIKALREVEFDYGLLPQPKYDSEQSEYYSLAQSNVMVIPSNIKDLEFAGTIIEALSYESYRNVMPALYEVTFENKYLRDDDSYAMFNIIKNSLVYDRLWNYAEGDGMVYFFSNLMSKNSTDLSSYYSANYEKTELRMHDFFDSVFEVYGRQ